MKRIIRCGRLGRRHYRHALVLGSSFLLAQFLLAQDGKTGITQATTMVGGYFDVAVTLMYAIGGVVGIIGAVKVYNAWSHGDQQTNKLAASWFAACIFLVVVAAVLKSFFALT